MSQGKVYLVGADPTDAELITHKSSQLLCQADIILHDHLIPSELLSLAKPTAQVISVGEFASQHTTPQCQIRTSNAFSTSQ